MPRVTPTVPTPGGHVDLRILADPRWHRAAVLDASELGMVVTAPGGNNLLVCSGDQITVRWLEPGAGLGMLDTAVAGTVRDGSDATWLLRKAGQATIVQRRRHVRVPVTVPVKAEWPDGQRQLLTMDLSEGGLRCLGRGPVELGPGDAVDLHVDLLGTPVTGTACVVRSAPTTGGTTVAFKFTSLSSQQADCIRRFVFARDVALNTLAR